jgi:hypothetical protein
LILSEKILNKNNKIKIKTTENKQTLLPFKSFLKIYHSNGLVAEEGICFYDKDIQIDFYMFGVWQYYNENGELIFKKKYKKAKLYD